LNSAYGKGLGDVRVGLAKTLLREPDLIARVTYRDDTGKRRMNGLSLPGGSRALRGELVALKRQDPLAFTGKLFYEHRYENDRGVQPGVAVGYHLSALLAASPETSMRFSFSQSFQGNVKVDGNKLKGTNEVQALLGIGASTILYRGVLLDFQVGAGLGKDSPDYVVNFSLPMRF
ncbi:MAG TPA: hypothetical protein VKA48_03395, partial [Gammaproteobacteria bacterium]|nr:hypothetical protein [Gammaproteobacteria bacterium]